MKFLSATSGFPSTYISSSTSFQEKIDEMRTAKIFHIDSDNFHSFLTSAFGEALDKKQDFSELFDIFFNQEECAVILDEGNLMILDDPGFGRIYSFKNTFATQPVDMRAPKELFDQMIGEEFLQTLNENFSGCYTSWYENASQNNQGKTTETREASGKTSNFVSSFSERIKSGSYQFSPLPFNFPAYVRSFRDVIFLSGSIDEKNFHNFKDFFTNGKENFYANIPLFFGTHNWNNNLIERKKIDNLEEEACYSQIESDIEETMIDGQPILLFAPPTTLEAIRNRLIERSIISVKNCIIIDNEKKS